MDETPTKGDQARAEIMEAARRLFITNGFHGTSMRGIAHEAGDRAVAGLYNHFSTKEAIFQALIEEGNPYNTILGVIESKLAEAHTGAEFVQSVLKTVLAIMPGYYDFLQLAQIDVREFEGRYIRHLLREEFFPRLLAVVQQLSALPGLKPMEPFVLVRMMASLVIGYVITERLGPAELMSQFPHEAFAEQFTAALLYGIAESD